MDKTVDAARGKWAGILEALGVDAKYLRNVHGPCPICQDGKDRFRFDDKDGDGTYICNQCGAGSGFTLIQKVRGWDFARAAREIDAVVGNVQIQEVKDQQTEAEKVAAIKRMMGKAVKLAPGVPAWDYLVGRCKITEPPADLWSHPGITHPSGSGTHPALLAVMRYADGQGSSIHRTFLTKDGWKAPLEPCRMVMPGKPINGSCVRLGTPVDGRVGIAEGIETALCASGLFGLPVWAAISAGGLTAWDPPASIQSVIIFGDNDATFTGQSSAYILARRLKLAGLEVDVQIPSVKGADWCDMMTSCASPIQAHT